MLSKTFGKTGKNISTIGFGGMRFTNPENTRECIELVHYAHSRGINYFDTAPVYCNDLSEELMGAALSQLPRDSYFLSSKCSKPSADEFRRGLERSLQRLQVECLDFFHVWHLMNPADWQKRLQGGAVEAAIRAREEGLIKHLVCSSHMQGDELSEVLAEDIFEGVLLGYNILNFPYRREAVKTAGAMGLGVVTMNPLAGGLIPQNPQRFDFLAQKGESVVTAALRFNISNPHVTSALVGFSNINEIDQAVMALQDFTPLEKAQLKALEGKIEAAFDELCTGCGYCLPCPVDIPIPRYLDAYNQVILNNGRPEAALNRLQWHWDLTGAKARDCIRCGLCEERCTQHLPIMQRLADMPVRKSKSTGA